MKRRTIYIMMFLLTILFAACGNNNNNEINSKDLVKKAAGTTTDEIASKSKAMQIKKKYPIKSGIITFNSTGSIGIQKRIVYFDEYGIKERSETFNEDGTIDEIKFCDGENIYLKNKYSGDEKIYYIIGQGSFGTEMKFDPDPFKYDKERAEKYSFQKLENMNILGKDCKAYSTSTEHGKTIFAGWNSFLLFTKVETSFGSNETVAVDMKEDAEVDPELFKVPADYKVSKM